jgi:hypothetical protein
MTRVPFPVGIHTVELCGCEHPERDHFPACLHTMKETTNRMGGGTTWLCGCPGFGSPAGLTLGRRRARRAARAMR